jgi:hypothetical protein
VRFTLTLVVCSSDVGTGAPGRGPGLPAVSAIAPLPTPSVGLRRYVTLLVPVQQQMGSQRQPDGRLGPLWLLLLACGELSKGAAEVASGSGGVGHRHTISGQYCLYQASTQRSRPDDGGSDRPDGSGRGVLSLVYCSATGRFGAFPRSSARSLCISPAAADRWRLATRAWSVSGEEGWWLHMESRARPVPVGGYQGGEGGPLSPSQAPWGDRLTFCCAPHPSPPGTAIVGHALVKHSYANRRFRVGVSSSRTK